MPSTVTSSVTSGVTSSLHRQIKILHTRSGTSFTFDLLMIVHVVMILMIQLFFTIRLQCTSVGAHLSENC